jgi:hypothetical protein
MLQAARNSVVRAVNQTMVLTYYKIGERIVEEEQNGKDRAEYGKSLLLGLSNVLTKEFGKGFSVTNIQQMRNFYLAYEKQQTLSVKSEKAIKQTASVIFNLSWSHYLILVRIENEDERNFYEIEASKNNWSVRELARQVNSSLYERLSISKEKEEIAKLSKNGQIIEKALDLIKDPYVLSF